MPQRTIAECPVCGREGEASREDVLPRWLLGEYEGKLRDEHGTSVEGPWSIGYGGSTVAVSDQMERVHLNVCKSCNGWLNRSFEDPAKSPMREVLAGRSASGAEVDALARWAVKTILLYGHPATTFTRTAHLEREGAVARPRLTGLESALRNLRSTGQLPTDLSLWIWLRDDSLNSALLAQVDTIALPRTAAAPGAGPGQGRVLGFGFTDDSGRSIQFQLLWHPLMDVANPHEGRAVVRMWPDPPSLLDPTVVPVLGKEDSKRASSWFVPGGMVVSLRRGERWSAELSFPS